MYKKITSYSLHKDRYTDCRRIHFRKMLLGKYRLLLKLYNWRCRLYSWLLCHYTMYKGLYKEDSLSR